MKESGFFNDDPNFIDYSDEDNSDDSIDEVDEESHYNDHLPKIMTKHHTPDRKSSKISVRTPHKRTPLDDEED